MEVQDAVGDLREIFGVRGHGSELDACVKTRKTGYSAIPVLGALPTACFVSAALRLFPSWFSVETADVSTSIAT